MTNMRTLLEVRLSIDYPARAGVTRDAAFEVRAGEVLGLAGSSGSGKSSLALAILRLLEWKGGRSSGELMFKCRDLMTATDRQMRAIRGREMAFVPQSPMSFLNPAMRIGAQMAEAWKAHRSGGRSEMDRAIADSFEDVGLPAAHDFLRRYPGELSVGQAQRVLIAMAILHRPDLLIADEPTSSLDVITQAEILRLFARLNRTLGTAILYISHDLLSVAELCDRVAILHEGRIVESGETGAIFAHPQHPYTQQLIDAIPALPEQNRRWAVEQIA